MKAIRIISIGALLFCGTLQSEDLMKNPGAEKVMPSAGYPKELIPARTRMADNVPENWGCYNGQGACRWGATEKEARSGQRSVFLEVMGENKTGVNFGLCIGNTNGYTGKEAIPTPGNTVYRFSFYLKGDIPFIEVVAVCWKASNSSSKGRRQVETTLKVITPTGEWTRYEGGFRVGKDIGLFALMLRVGAKGDEVRNGQIIYVDDVELQALKAHKLDNGSPMPIRVGIYESSPSIETTSRKYIYEALKNVDGIMPGVVSELRQETLKKYDVLVLSTLKNLSEADKENQRNGGEWRAAVLNFIDSGKGIILGHDCVGFRHEFGKDKIFAGVCSGRGRVDWKQELQAVDRSHPVLKSLPASFPHSYSDHIAITPGPDAKVLAKDRDGNPVIVVGGFSRGRIVALGYPMGIRTEKESRKSTDAPLAEAEKTILLNSVRWCAEPPRYDVPETLTRTVLLPEVARRARSFAEAEDAKLLHFVPSASYAARIPPPSGNPYGGGKGYKQIISADSTDYIVDSPKGLLDALARATPGQVVYVKDDAAIDLTGHQEITIPAGVTLASGRGKLLGDGSVSEGGLVRTFSHGMLFVAGGSDIRITGLRLGGPAPDINPPSTSSRCVTSSFSLEVDNCRIWGWVIAIHLKGEDNSSSRIHNNIFHHCRQEGTGYGVNVGQNNVRIEENIFDYCRHAVAAGRRSSYEAAYNIFGKNMNSTTLDMHGANDAEKTYMRTNWRFDEIENNTAFDSSEGACHPRSMNNLTVWGARSVKNEIAGGRFGAALQFDGQADYAECLNAGDFKSLQGAIEFRLKPDILGDCRDILFLHDNSDSFLLVRKNPDDKLEVIIKEQGKIKIDVTSTKALNKNYCHVIISGGAGRLRIYIDGTLSELNGSGLTSTAWTDYLENPKLWIGKGPENFFAGILDEVRIYSRRLDDEQVVRHFKYPDMAGEWLKIHHNVFYSDYPTIIGIRGIPCREAEIHNNWFEAIFSPDKAIMQYAPGFKPHIWSRWKNNQHNGIGVNINDNTFKSKDKF